MAQLNITLNEEEILLLMQTDRTDAFRKILENSLNQFLKAESTEQLNAERYERTEGRTDSRNGSYTRTLTTRLGTITLAVPRHRKVLMVFNARASAFRCAECGVAYVCAAPQPALIHSNGTTFEGAFCSAIHSVNFCCIFIQLSADVPVARLILIAISGLKEDFSFTNSDKAFLLTPSIAAVCVTERFKGFITSSRNTVPG